jgi:hypothetical protein
VGVPEEPYPLTNAYFKTERAKVHLDSLRQEIIAFEKSNPYTIRPKEEPEGDAVRYRIEVHHPRVGLFLIAADILQCLRTALDQAVWSLANLSHPDPDWTQFPIVAESLNSKGRKRFDEQTFGIPTKAISYIESLQPYNRPAGTHILSPLNVIPTDYGYDIISTGFHKHLEPRLTPIVVVAEKTSGIVLSLSGIESIYEIVSNEILPTLSSFAK